MDSVSKRTRMSLSGGDNYTPKTLIQGFLQTAQTVRQSPRKRARVTPNASRTTPAAGPSSASRNRSKTPRTLPRPPTGSRRRSTRIETLATPGGSDPTPRGLITGFLRAADAQTPAVHATTRRSSPLKQPTPALPKNVLQTRAESTNSSSLESPADEPLSRFVRPQAREGRSRRRPVIDNEEFAARVKERMGQEEDGEGGEEEEEEEERREESVGPRDQSRNRTLLENIVEEPVDKAAEESIDSAEDEPVDSATDEPVDNVPEGPQDSAMEEPLDSAMEELQDSAAEEPLDISRPKPDSTTRDTSAIRAPSSSEGSGRRSRTRRSILQDESLQVPSTSTGPGAGPGAGPGTGERKASNQSASSAEDESLMIEATQDTIQAQPSSNEEMEDEDDREREESRAEAEEESGRERLEAGVRGRDIAPVARSDKDSGDADVEAEEEEEEEMDVGSDEEFADESLPIAPTQPVALESVKKRPRGSLSPLKTPHLRATKRHSIPAAKTPAFFKPAANSKQPLRPKAAPKQTASRSPTGAKEPPSTLPRSLTKSIFTHFSKARVSRNALAVVDEASSKFFRNISKDLTAYCKHANRHTIERADVELLMKRQRLVSNKETLNTLIEKYLPMEYREELIPMARSGNKVYPKMPKK